MCKECTSKFHWFITIKNFYLLNDFIQSEKTKLVLIFANRKEANVNWAP